MENITIQLSEERLARLRELAREARIPPEEFLRSKVEDWLEQPDREFLQATEYVLKKNRELYRRF